MFDSTVTQVSPGGVEFSQSQPGQDASLTVVPGGGIVFTLVAGGERRPQVATGDDKSVSVGRARAICDESVALLTEGLDPRQARVVVGTESDVARLQRATDHIAARRTLASVL